MIQLIVKLFYMYLCKYRVRVVMVARGMPEVSGAGGCRLGPVLEFHLGLVEFSDPTIFRDGLGFQAPGSASTWVRLEHRSMLRA